MYFKLPNALQWTQSKISYLHDALEGLVALLVSSTLGQVPPDANVLPQENLTMLFQPVKHLGNGRDIVSLNLEFCCQPA